jgi:hypothetical protein
MISGNLGWDWLSLSWLCRSGLGCGSVMVRLHDAIEVVTLE